MPIDIGNLHCRKHQREKNSWRDLEESREFQTRGWLYASGLLDLGQRASTADGRALHPRDHIVQRPSFQSPHFP